MDSKYFLDIFYFNRCWHSTPPPPLARPSTGLLPSPKSEILPSRPFHPLLIRQDRSLCPVMRGVIRPFSLLSAFNVTIPLFFRSASFVKNRAAKVAPSYEFYVFLFGDYFYGPLMNSSLCSLSAGSSSFSRPRAL